MRIDCSCGKRHNAKSAAKIMKRCKGTAVTRMTVSAMKVAAPDGRPIMIPSVHRLYGSMPGSAALRDIVAETAARQRADRVGGTCGE